MTPESTRWSPDPAVVATLAAALAAYALGAWSLRRRGRRRDLRWRAVAYLSGLALVALAIASPLEEASETLVSAHMVQHLVLVLGAAPLLVLARPHTPLLLALPGGWRRAVGRARASRPLRTAGRALTHPVTAWLLHVVVLWAWHAPRAYQAAVENEALHVLEHAAFLGTALPFWSVALEARARVPGGARVLLLLTAWLQSAALGALLTLAPAPIYPLYERATAAAGLDPLRDQQLAGLAMWIPAGFVYLGAAGGTFVGWLRQEERELRAADAGVRV